MRHRVRFVALRFAMLFELIEQMLIVVGFGRTLRFHTYSNPPTGTIYVQFITDFYEEKDLFRWLQRINLNSA